MGFEGSAITKYPPKMNCDTLSTFFLKDEKLNQRQFYDYAKLDKNFTLDATGGGYYQCYCEKYYDDNEMFKHVKDHALVKLEE